MAIFAHNSSTPLDLPTMEMSTPSLVSRDMSGTTTAVLEAVTEVTPDNAETLRVVRYAVQKVCVPVVVCLGMVGNIFSMVVLTRRSMTNSTNCYLTALAAFDTLYLIFSLTLSFKHYQTFHRAPVYVHWFPYGRVLTDMAANVSVLLTVTFTVERYIGVCHPIRGRVICTPQRAKVVTALVVFVAIACTVPELFEMEVVWKTEKGDNQSYPAWQYTDFSATYSYRIGYHWFLVTTFTFMPLLLLCVFNGILAATLFRAAELRTRMTSVTSSASSPSRLAERYWREQHRITKMLVTVVLVFILCQLPGAILLLIWAYNELVQVEVSAHGRNRLLIAANVTNFLMQINAAINFLLYSMTSCKFRRVFYRTLCLWDKYSSLRTSRHSTFKTDLPLTSVFTNSVRNIGSGFRRTPTVVSSSPASSVSASKHAQQMQFLIGRKPRREGGAYRNGSAAHAWRAKGRSLDGGGVYPANENCCTETDKHI